MNFQCEFKYPCQQHYLYKNSQHVSENIFVNILLTDTETMPAQYSTRVLAADVSCFLPVLQSPDGQLMVSHLQLGEALLAFVSLCTRCQLYAETLIPKHNQKKWGGQPQKKCAHLSHWTHLKPVQAVSSSCRQQTGAVLQNPRRQEHCLEQSDHALASANNSWQPSELSTGQN